MDEMKINSKFMKEAIAKMVQEVIRKKTGYEVDIQLNELSAEVIEGAPKVHLSLDAGLHKDELERILKTVCEGFV